MIYWTDFLSNISDRFEKDIMRMNQYELKALIHLATIYVQEDFWEEEE